MTIKQRQAEWHEKEIQIALEELSITKDQYKQFVTLGKKLNKIYCDNCNGYLGTDGNWSDELQEKAEAKESKLVSQVNSLCTSLNLYYYLQTDPRGATIYLDTKEIPDNSYNNAHCIY